MTRWASHAGGMSGWGEDILLRAEEQAKAWTEEHLTAEEYETLFAVDEENPEYVTYTVWIKPETRDLLDELVKKSGLSRGQILDDALKNYSVI